MLKIDGNAHPHVRECSRNPKKGDYFAPVKKFFELRANDKKNAIIQYMKQKVPSDSRKTILHEIQRELQDIQIDIQESEVMDVEE
jgi:hypothetical protein